jgi:putative phosphotransacetylase
MPFRLSVGKKDEWRMKKVPIGVSARHIHLSVEHAKMLFGDGYALSVYKELSQPGQFAAVETVDLIGPKGKFERTRILGPLRGKSQVEISRTDAYALGLNPPLRESGKIEGTPGLIVRGPLGEIELQRGVIVAARHIHFHTSEALAWGIRHNEKLSVEILGERSLIFNEVIAKVSDRYALDFHIDTDEANAAGVKTGDWARIL